MTSAVGGGRGSPKSRRKEQNQLICDSDKGGEGPKNPKILRTLYMEGIGSPQIKYPTAPNRKTPEILPLEPGPLQDLVGLHLPPEVCAAALVDEGAAAFHDGVGGDRFVVIILDKLIQMT